jgi:hypothetical protein
VLIAGWVVKGAQRVTNLLDQIEAEGGFDRQGRLKQLQIKTLRA